jgi:DNA-binding response OmpR family regulator
MRRLAYYESLTRVLMQCCCGERFVLSCVPDPAFPPAAAPTDREHGQANDPRVLLLVDRDADNRELYAEFLRFHGWRVEPAESADEGLLKASALRPAVIATELRLRDGDGLEMCRVLRQQPETRSIPLVILTAETRSTHLDAAREVAARILVKPCGPGDVLAVISNLLPSP